MIETLTMAVIVLATCLVGLALIYSVLLSDHSRRIERIRKEFNFKLQRDIEALGRNQRDADSKTDNLEMRHDRAIDNLSTKVEKHENTFKALTGARRVARWRAFNKFNIMHEEESPRCEYCLSDDTEYDTEYIEIAGISAPDRLVSQCCNCGQKSTIWRFDDE